MTAPKTLKGNSRGQDMANLKGTRWRTRKRLSAKIDRATEVVVVESRWRAMNGVDVEHSVRVQIPGVHGTQVRTCLDDLDRL